MTAIVLGCDELLGAVVCERVLEKGQQVYGYSLQTNISSYQKQKLEQLSSSGNGHHFIFQGPLLEQDWQLERQLQQQFDVYFLPSQEMAKNHAQLLLAHCLKLQALCQQLTIRHLVCSSSYKLYYPHQHTNACANELVDHPRSLQAATLRSMELLLHGLSAQCALPCTIVRLFELYGDVQAESGLVANFWQQIASGKAIELSHWHNDILDFVFVDDAAEGVIRFMEHVAMADPDWEFDEDCLDRSEQPWRVYNLGTGEGTSVADLLKRIAEATGTELHTSGSWQPGYTRFVAEMEKTAKHLGFMPRIQL